MWKILSKKYVSFKLKCTFYGFYMVKIGLFLSIILLIYSCESKNKQTVYVSLESKFYPERLNPAQIGRFSEDNVYSQIYETLLKIDDDQKTLLPNLARKWHFSDNKRKVEILLQKNVLFHDNTKFSAYSVKKSYKWLISENPSSSLLSMIDSIEVRDSLTLHIHLKYPYAPFFYILTSPFGLVILSEKAIQKFGRDIEFHPVGTGPFYLKEWEIRKKIQLNSFDNYWGGIKKNRSLIFKSYSEKYSNVNALRDGKVDLTFPVSGSVSNRLKWTGLIEYKVSQSLNLIYLGFNMNKPPFKDIRVRNAISHAIHKDKLGYYNAGGNAIIAKGPIPPDLINYNNFVQTEYDISKAKTLLKEAGFEKGMFANFFFPSVTATRLVLSEFIKTELAKIGITLNITLYDSWEKFLNEVQNKNSQMFIDSWGDELAGDVGNILYSLFSSKSTNNLTQYRNSTVDRLLDKSREEFDYYRRQQIYREIVKEILDDTPAVFLYHMKQHYAYNKHRIKYLPVNPYGIIQFHRIIMN